MRIPERKNLQIDERVQEWTANLVIAEVLCNAFSIVCNVIHNISARLNDLLAFLVGVNVIVVVAYRFSNY